MFGQFDSFYYFVKPETDQSPRVLSVQRTVIGK